MGNEQFINLLHTTAVTRRGPWYRMVRTNIAALIVFLLTIVFITYPLLPPGYILSLDLPTTENVPTPILTSNSFLFDSIVYLVHFVIPNFVIQKIILVLALFLAGWGMYRLVPVQSWGAKLFAGILYMVNPFTYGRLVSGQWLFVLGYALFPWLVASVVARNVVVTILLFTLMASVSLHFFFFAGLFLIIYTLVTVSFGSVSFFSALRMLVKVMGATILLNLHWFIPWVLGTSTIGGYLTIFGANDLTAFQSVKDPNFGLLFNLLSGYGFWAESKGYFLSPKTFLPIWPLFTVAFFGLSVYGFYLAVVKGRQRLIGVTLGLIFLLSVDLAAGVALPRFSGTIYWLYETIPLLRGLREPQKLIGLILFCYAYFGPLGLAELLRRVGAAKKVALSLLALAIPIGSAIPMFFGFGGQLRPVWYPESWTMVNEKITQEYESIAATVEEQGIETGKDVFIILFFPWRPYMKFSFVNNATIANPASRFFDTPALSLPSYETLYLQSQDARPEALHITGLLTIEKEGVNLLGEPVKKPLNWGEALTAINVKYLILAKEADWKTYRFLDTAVGMKKVYEDDVLILYENADWIRQSGIDQTSS